MHIISEVMKMRIAIPTNAGGLEDTVAPVFGRAQTFTIVDVDENGEVRDVKVIQNPAMNAAGGAGPMAIQTLLNEGVEAIVAPQLGPNAAMAAQAAGLRVYTVAPGTPAKEAINAVKGSPVQTGTVTFPATAPVLPAPGTAPVYGPYPAYGPTWGYGFGWGRGWGRGRGFGRGWGRGGRGWGARLGYCPWTGMPSRRTLRWYYGWW